MTDKEYDAKWASRAPISSFWFVPFQYNARHPIKPGLSSTTYNLVRRGRGKRRQPLNNAPLPFLARDYSTRLQALGNDCPFLLGAPTPTPLWASDDLNPRHRTVSNTSAYQPYPKPLCKTAVTGRLPSFASSTISPAPVAPLRSVAYGFFTEDNITADPAKLTICQSVW